MEKDESIEGQWVFDGIERGTIECFIEDHCFFLFRVFWKVKVATHRTSFYKLM